MKLHLSRDADFSIENYYAKQERVTRTGIVIFTGVCHIYCITRMSVTFQWWKWGTVIVIYFIWLNNPLQRSVQMWQISIMLNQLWVHSELFVCDCVIIYFPVSQTRVYSILKWSHLLFKLHVLVVCLLCGLIVTYIQYMNKDYVKNNYENLHNVLHTCCTLYVFKIHYMMYWLLHR